MLDCDLFLKKINTKTVFSVLLKSDYRFPVLSPSGFPVFRPSTFPFAIVFSVDWKNPRAQLVSQKTRMMSAEKAVDSVVYGHAKLCLFPLCPTNFSSEYVVQKVSFFFFYKQLLF